MSQNPIIENEFTDSFTGTNAPVWILDRNLSSLLWANEAGFRYWGVEPETDTRLMNKGWEIADLLPATQFSCWQKFANNCHEITDSVLTELKINPTELTSNPLKAQISPVRLMDQTEILLFQILDTHEDKPLAFEQEALCAENADVLIALYDGDGSLSYQNLAMAKAIENTSFTSLFDKPEVAAQILKTLETEEFTEVEYELLTNTGLCWYSFTIRSVTNNVRPTSSILVTGNSSNKWHRNRSNCKNQ